MKRADWWWITPLAMMFTGLATAELWLRELYRRRVLPGNRPAGQVTIVALGDSIVAGSPYGHADAWPALLSTRLQSQMPGLQWRVLNRGCDGDTAPLGFNRFDDDVAAYGPDVVLIAFGLNDCYPDRHPLDAWYERRVPRGPSRSFLWRALRLRAERLTGRLGLPVGPSLVAGRGPGERTSPGGFSTALAALASRCRAIGAQAVLVTMTPLASGNMAEVQTRLDAYPAYNQRIREMAYWLGLPLVDLAEDTTRPTFEPDGVHLDRSGQAWVAGRVYDSLEHAGLWARFTVEA